jgi:ferredoxin-nitrite reductase
MGGKMPRFGSDLDAFVTPEEAPRLCEAILSLFRDHGPRENRQKARLKWLIEEWGIERFRDELQRYYGPLTSAGRDEVISYGADHIGVQRQKQLGMYAVGCLVPVGRTTGDDLVELGRLAEEYGSGEVRLTNDQNVLIVNVHQSRLQALLAEPLLQKYSPAPSAFMRRTVSCTGNDYCHFALIDTKGAAVDLAQAMDELMPMAEPLRIHWSGCPHACGQHHIGDIGLQAARVRVGDTIVDAADVFIGGKPGLVPQLGTKVLDNVPLTELPHRLATLVTSTEGVALGEVAS